MQHLVTTFNNVEKLAQYIVDFGATGYFIYILACTKLVPTLAVWHSKM